MDFRRQHHESSGHALTSAYLNGNDSSLVTQDLIFSPLSHTCRKSVKYIVGHVTSSFEDPISDKDGNRLEATRLASHRFSRLRSKIDVSGIDAARPLHLYVTSLNANHHTSNYLSIHTFYEALQLATFMRPPRD